MILNSIRLTLLSSLLASVTFSVRADTLSDLKNVLTNLHDDGALAVEYTSKYTQNRGKQSDLKTKKGFITLSASYNEKGLQVAYNKEILDKVALEETLKEQDENADTPTLNAMYRVESSDLLEMMSAAPSLLRFINKAKFKTEKQVQYQDTQARELMFDMPLESIITDQETRDHVDDFKGQFRLLVNSNNIPIESELTFTGSGSAYVFFSIKLAQTITNQYQLLGTRLVNTGQSYSRKQSSTFGQSDSNGEKKLTIITDNKNEFERKSLTCKL
ncbi:MAG: hypothetical protein ACJAZB_000564 [Psychrosphaera sp.]|jgi:hypothetical protein